MFVSGLFQTWLSSNAGGGNEASFNSKIASDVKNIFQRVGFFSLELKDLEEAIFLSQFEDNTIYNLINSFKVFLR